MKGGEVFKKKISRRKKLTGPSDSELVKWKRLAWAAKKGE